MISQIYCYFVNCTMISQKIFLLFNLEDLKVLVDSKDLKDFNGWYLIA